MAAAVAMFFLQGCLTSTQNMIFFSDVMTAPPDGAVEVTEVDGTAEARGSDDDSWSPLGLGQAVRAGSKVRTIGRSTVKLKVDENGSTLIVQPNSLVEIVFANAKNQGMTAVNVKVRVLVGDVTGSFQGGAAPSTIEIIGPNNIGSIFRPAAGQSMSASLSVPEPDIFSPFGETDALFFGMHPNFTVMQIIPEPSQSALVGWAILMAGRQLFREKNRRRG